MLYHKEKNEANGLDFSRCLRIIEIDKPTYDLWVRRGGKSFSVKPVHGSRLPYNSNNSAVEDLPRCTGDILPTQEPSDIDNPVLLEGEILGTTDFASKRLPILGSRSKKFPTKSELHAIENTASLESVCGQFILSSFISNIAKKCLAQLAVALGQGTPIFL
jgi:hypothetical protein